MAKLYILAIGGTGSRVLKAFTMLLASGVKLDKSIEKVIPIIIDPDIDNGDMNRTRDILRLYYEIRNKLTQPEDFFTTNIQTLSQIINQESPFSHDNFQFKIDGADTQKFYQFIGAGEIEGNNRALRDLLYSKKNLESEMRVGFKGNPNIGSVVLNQLIKSKQYLDFAQSYSPGDKIFIINSIFGGTGAAGFPLLLKNLRSGNSNIPNAAEIRNASIGGLTVLPYFNVENNDSSEIDSDSFLEKAKSAMSYYDRSIIHNDELNCLYYIGDIPKTTYPNVEGSNTQKNEAHFVEFAGALSIFDFTNHANVLNTLDGKAQQAYFKEFGVEKDDLDLNFKSLDDKTRKMIMPALSKFVLSYLFLNLGSDNSSLSNWMRDKETKTNKVFFSSPEYQNMFKKFHEYFMEWIDEMARNEISFKPFNTDVNKDNAMRFINEYNPSKAGFIKSDDSFKKVDVAMNDCFRQYNAESTINQLVNTLEKSTESVLSKRNLI